VSFLKQKGAVSDPKIKKIGEAMSMPTTADS